MSDDPHPCMKVTSHIRNFIKVSAAAVHIQEQKVPQIISDEHCGSSVLNTVNIAVFTLNQNKIIFSDDLRPFLVAPAKKVQRMRTAVWKQRLQNRRFSLI